MCNSHSNLDIFTKDSLCMNFVHTGHAMCAEGIVGKLGVGYTVYDCLLDGSDRPQYLLSRKTGSEDNP